MKYALLLGAWLLASCVSVQIQRDGATNAGLERELIALERQSWVAWQNHDGAFFDRFLSGDHVEVGNGGPAPKAVVVRLVASGACTVESYTIDHFSFTQFNGDSALLVYRADQNTMCGGRPVPTPVWATSLFVRRGAHWENAVYVHSPIPHP